ncbi:1,3-beta-glucanosyltransferase [Mortierella sp. 14UC]|nr:1,3-beta-glucanosyltransferase [Mortierella sp. 14UC]
MQKSVPRHSRFDPSLSSTVTELKTPWKIAYGDGSTVSGHLAVDRLEFSEVTIENQLIGLADRESSSFLEDVVDGVFGLGFPSLSAKVLDDQKDAEARVQGPISNTVLSSILSHELIPAPVFGVWLGNGDGEGSDANGGDGEFSFGSIDASRFEGDLTFLPITHQRYWQVQIDGVQLDGIGDLSIKGDAIIDTGTTLLVFPIAQAKKVNKAIGAKSDPWEGWILPCDSNQEGSLDFWMGGNLFSVRRKDLVREKVPHQPGWCYSAVTTAPGDTIIFGDVFIRNNYCVFDVEDMTIGIAPHHIHHTHSHTQEQQQRQHVHRTLDTAFNALASNRDELLARTTSRADFWDLDPILAKAIQQSQPTTSSDNAPDPTPVPVPAPTESRPSLVGVLTGQDLQPSQATNYTIQELFSFSNQEQEQVALTLDTMDIPGTWLGMTTHGDFVALTNFRESDAYMAMERDPKLSRGKVCGEFLVTMAAAHHKGQEDQDAGENSFASAPTDGTGEGAAADQIDTASAETRSMRKAGSRVRKDQAEKWIRRRAVGWEDEFEGLNLLVVQNAGDLQCVGGNRLGCELSVFNKSASITTAADSTVTATPTILEDSVVGVSNSVFTQPWNKVKIGAKALESVLNQSIALFGTGPQASYNKNSNNSNASSTFVVDDDTKEIAWLVVQMLTLLRTNTQPFPPEDLTSLPKMGLNLRERVFIPRINFGGPNLEYGTRSSTIVLFGRERDGEGAGGVAVLVEKVWYGEKDAVTSKRTEYSPDSSEGLVWWQGRVGQPRQQWRRVLGEELEVLLAHARDIGHITQA